MGLLLGFSKLYSAFFRSTYTEVKPQRKAKKTYISEASGYLGEVRDIEWFVGEGQTED